MVDTDKIEEVVEGSEAAVGPPFTADSVGAAGADVRGLAAVEHVAVPARPHRARHLARTRRRRRRSSPRRPAEARAAWTEGTNGDPAYADLVAKPGNETYGDSQAVLDDLVNGMAMALSEATKALADAESAPPGRARHVGSHGGDQVRDTLWSVRASYEGSLTNGDGRGVGALVADASSDADERFRRASAHDHRCRRALPADLDARGRTVDRAYLASAHSAPTPAAEVASILGVTLSLSDSDGDS